MNLNVMDLNWVELEELDKEKTVMFLGIAPIEQHGRHLPTGVDVYETEHWIVKSIEKLEKEFEDYIFLTMPMITYGYANMKGIVGSLHLSEELIFQLVVDSLRAITAYV